MNPQIRAIQKGDEDALKIVLDSTGLFPSEFLDSMIADYFSNPISEEIWFTVVQANQPIALAYCVPEKFTAGTYNLLAIGVHEDYQGKGIGKSMMQYLEQLLQTKKARILIVETSGKEDFQLTRSFYHQCQYIQQATIPEFYDEQDDKIIFWKKLNT